jgi:hypothetical protein
MVQKEKGGPAGGRQIPNSVRKDNLEFISQHVDLQQLLQVSRLKRRCATSTIVAEMLAPFVFGEVSR